MPSKEKPAGRSRESANRSAGSGPKKEVYREMTRVAKENGFRVTSTTGDKHNAGSAHYQGRAIDVSIRNKTEADIQRLSKAAQANGWKVRDERTKPAGQKVWSAPHIHIEAPKKR